MTTPLPTAIDKVRERVGLLRETEVMAVLSCSRNFVDLEVARGRLVSVGRFRGKRFPAAADYMENRTEGGGPRGATKPLSPSKPNEGEQKKGPYGIARTARKETENA